MAKIAGPNIGVTASAGNVKIVMDDVQRELDRVNATPLRKLRDTSEEALKGIKQSVAGTVENIVKLKTELANTGGVNNRLLKATEKQFEALKRLGVNPEALRGIDSALGEITGRGSRSERAKAIREEREESRLALVRQAQQEVRAEQEKRNARARDLRKQRDEERRDAIRGIEQEAEAFGRKRRELQARGGGPGGGGGSTQSGGGFANAVGLLDAATGGRKFDLNKGLQFGLAGVVAGFVSDTLAGATRGALQSRNEGGEVFSGIAESLPVVRGIKESLGNVYELYTDISRASENTASNFERERNAVASVNSLLNERLKLISDAERKTQNQAARFAASQQGGRAGRVASVDAEFGANIRDLGAQQLDRRRQIESETTATLAPLQSELIALRVKRSNVRDDTTRALLTSQILSNETAQSKIRQVGLERIEESNKAIEQQRELLRSTYAIEGNIAEGRFENTRALGDRLEQLQNEIDTVSADPIEQIRKEMEKLNPSSMVKINEALAKYKERQDTLKKERRAFSATEGAKDFLDSKASIGGSAIDRQIQDLLNAGVTDTTLIAKVRIKLEAEEAARVADDLKRRLQDIGLNLGVTLARNLRDRVKAEVDAEDARQRRDGGVGLTPSQRAALERAKLDEAFAGDAQRTRDSAKTPQERLGESLDSLTEQFRRGFITERELRAGVGTGIQDLANASRTERPQLITAEDKGLAQQFLAIGTGKAVDASRPELVLQKEANVYLKEIKDAVSQNRRVRVAIAA